MKIKSEANFILLRYRSFKEPKTPYTNIIVYTQQAQAEKKLGLTDIRPTMYLKITGYGSLPMPNVPMSVHC